MNPKQLVKLSNGIGLVAILLLIYWVFIFITINIFGLKIFKEYISQTFYLSVLGILALMGGALIINIMFNLTRIAEKHNQDQNVLNFGSKLGWLFLLSFPVLLGLLFLGDHLSSEKKERMLINSAESIILSNEKKTAHLGNYKFQEDWILETKHILNILSKTDDNFPHISIIVKDSIDNEPAFLGFTRYYNGKAHDTILPQKQYFINKTTKQEREYLNKVFDTDFDEKRYSSYNGKYELFIPYSKGKREVVMYFSEYQRYGKMGISK